ncbi:hypothetical protein BJ166DRAFT_526974 [Pestalotiopsis sp. NC0098]|nr:hypothetical protein BJ166DRAFT_526974 [Pestalotiopsis sp. NC0098]
MPPRFKPPASAPARQTIKTAFEDLDRTITPVDSRDFSTTTLEHVRKAALEIENQLAARQSLRNMRRLVPLFEGLEHYSKVVDVLCNGTSYLPWIWAPITLILRVALEYVEAFEVIMKGYTKIAESLVRFEILDSAFKDDHGFQRTLAVFYSDILQFHKFAYTFVRRSSWKLLFLTSWGRFQRRFDGIVESLDRHGTLVDQEASARHIAESRQRWQEAQMWREEEQERLTQQENELAMKQFRYISLWLKADDSEQVTVQDLASSEGIRYPGTCSWALKNQKLVAWLRKDTESCLCWLQGIPGSGKSVLMTQIQAFMRSDSRAIVSHFLNSSYATSTVYDQILRSLLLQLLKGDGDLTAHVYSKYVMGKKTTTISILEELIKTLFTATSHEPRKTQFRWILIDGFESCESNKQASLISLVKQLISKNPQSGGTVCKVLISSRSSPILSKRLGRKQIISLTEEKQALDIAITDYATLRLNSLRERFDQLHLDHHDLENIKLAVAKKADGMFLYARLILDYLGRKIFYSGAEVKKSIEDLPQELSDYYREILARIIAPLDVESVERVRSLFGWLAFAKRPLKRLELLSAITFGCSDHLVSHLVPEFILVVCGALVDERPDATLAFIHSTVNESVPTKIVRTMINQLMNLPRFLQSASSNLLLNQTASINEHGIASITCLQAGMHFFSGNFTEHEIELRVVAGLHGFHLYAADHWVDVLLTAVAIATTSISELPLYRLAVALAERVNGPASNNSLKEHRKECNDMDGRLNLIPDLSLRELAKSVLKLRSPKALEQQVPLPTDIIDSSKDRCGVPPRTPLQATVIAYQDAVRHLLKQPDHPGVSSEELQRFKHQFRNSAFTCRLGACPKATLGFESEAMRDDHELAHSKPIMCSFPDCRYPPFSSLRLMEKHKNRIHLASAIHRPIRKPDKPTNPVAKLLRHQEAPSPACDLPNLLHEDWHPIGDGDTRNGRRTGMSTEYDPAFINLEFDGNDDDDEVFDGNDDDDDDEVEPATSSPVPTPSLPKLKGEDAAPLSILSHDGAPDWSEYHSWYKKEFLDSKDLVGESITQSARSSSPFQLRSRAPTDASPSPVPYQRPQTPVPLSDEMRLKENFVFFQRCRLQKGLIPREGPIEESDMQTMSDHLVHLESFPDLEASIIRATTVAKLLRAILRIPEIPKESEYNFKPRSRALLLKWNDILAADPLPEVEAVANGFDGISGEGAKESLEPPTFQSRPLHPEWSVSDYESMARSELQVDTTLQRQDGGLSWVNRDISDTLGSTLFYSI